MFKFKKPDREVHTTYLHHTASRSPEHDTIEWLYNLHVLQNGWSDVAYHYLIDYDGNILKGRSLETQPAAQAGFNKGSIAICVAGIGDSFNDAQLEALKLLCKTINKAYGGEMVFRGHKEVMSTECPHYDYKALLKLEDSGRIPRKNFFSLLLSIFKPRNHSL